MGFIESLIMTIFSKKALKEIANEFSDEPPVYTQNKNARASYYTLREVYHDIGDFSSSLLGELFRREPDFINKESGEDARELLEIQVTHYMYKGVLYSSETWFSISAENRFLCKKLLSSLMDKNYRDHDLIDYSNRLFSPIANPAQHSITIGDYTLYYKYALFYNLTLMLLIDSDNKYLAGKHVADKAVRYSKIQITEGIARQYDLTVDEANKSGVHFEKQSYSVLDDFNSPDVHNQRTGWFEVRIIDGTAKSDSAVPYSIAEMREAESSYLFGNIWPSIIPGNVFFGTEYVPTVPFEFLQDADALTIRGSEHTCELYICRLEAGWGGIKFKLQSKADYYRLAAWLIPVLSYYCSIIRGWDYHSLISEYWPTYPLNNPDISTPPITTDEPVSDVGSSNDEKKPAPVAPTLRTGIQGRRIASSQKEQFLLDTYDLLKANYAANRWSLWDLIGQMAKLNRDSAVSMWKELIAANPDVLHSSNDFGFSIMYRMEEAIGREWAFRLVAEDDELRNAIYSELGDMKLTPICAIPFFVLIDEGYLADELLELTFKNKYRCNSFYEILDCIIPNCPSEHITDEAFELLVKWIEKTEDPEEKAKLNLKILIFMNEVKE